MKELLAYKIVNHEIEIKAPDEAYAKEVKLRWDQVAKPLDSLGVFETMTAQMGAILQTADLDFSKRTVISMCADNGIVEEGISQSGQEITLAVAKAMGQKASSVGKMAQVNGTKTMPIDIGIHSDEEISGVISAKVAKGTKNFLKESAMSEEEMYQAMQVGMDAVKICKEAGDTLIGIGEMGIGNTTTSAAIVSALLQLPAELVVGRGAGLDDEKLKRKQQVVAEAVRLYETKGRTEDKAEDRLQISEEAYNLYILQSVGGLDIAGLVGVMLGGAYYGIPVVLDGVISLAAALVTVRILPEVRDYLFASHASKEPATMAIFEALQMEPIIMGNLALGEGTGAVMLFALLDTAMALYENGTSFAGMEIDAYERYDKK